MTAGGQNLDIKIAVHRPLLNPALTGNQTPKNTWSVLGPPIVAFCDQQGLLKTHSSIVRAILIKLQVTLPLIDDSNKPSSCKIIPKRFLTD